MQIKKLSGSLLLSALLLFPIYACNKGEGDPIIDSEDGQVTASISTSQWHVPILTHKSDNTILNIKLHVEGNLKCTIEKITISLEGTTELNDIESIRLFYIGTDENTSNANRQFGETAQAAAEIIFNDKLSLSQNTFFFRLSVKLKTQVDLLHKIDASCESIRVNQTQVIQEAESPSEPLRIGTALRQHGDDGIDTYRIPGLTTSRNGTLLAIYDARRESSRDLQGNMDIGLSRSTDGGDSWEPMKIALDRGEWGNLPQKFNGISDACILVNEQNNDIFIAGLWMYGVLDKNGKWIEGLNESSTDWQHQWSGKGSQPGFGEKQTCQFLITKSTDDGQTWSEPTNLTQMCKKEEWWLFAPAPGHGITLEDGTLVFPTQGRDASGNSFSNITWSKDGGTTWHSSNPASVGTTENMVVQLSDGSIMLNARDGKNKGNTSSTNGRVISISNDLGKNWTVHSSSRGALMEPGCMASLHKHVYSENGQQKSILLFSNPSSKTDRDHMTIKVSFDEGKTWPEKYWLLLDEKKGRGYSCLTSIDEQTIGILYESSQSDMTFQKIRLSELITK